MRKVISLSVASTLASAFLFVGASTAFANGPSGVNGLRAYSGPGKGQVTLEWSRVSLTGENYSVRYGTSSGSYPWVASHIGYVATYTVSNLTPGTKYFFGLERIQIGDVSIGTSGEVSAIAPRVAVTVPGVAGPVGRNLLVATGAGRGSVKLSWRQFFPDSNGWHIVYGTGPGMYQYGVLNAVSTVGGVSDYNFTIHALKRGKTYYFALVPVRGGVAQYITAEVAFVAP